jgi:hypothetical protein
MVVRTGHKILEQKVKELNNDTSDHTTTETWSQLNSGAEEIARRDGSTDSDLAERPTRGCLPGYCFPRVAMGMYQLDTESVERSGYTSSDEQDGFLERTARLQRFTATNGVRVSGTGILTDSEPVAASDPPEVPRTREAPVRSFRPYFTVEYDIHGGYPRARVVWSNTDPEDS